MTHELIKKMAFYRVTTEAGNSYRITVIDGKLTNAQEVAGGRLFLKETSVTFQLLQDYVTKELA